MEEYVAFQVQLERRQHRLLKEVAARRGTSMGSLVRESVAAYLTSLPLEEDPLYGLIGMLSENLGDLPYGDIGPNHDAYLADIYEAEGKKPRPGDAVR